MQTDAIGFLSAMRDEPACQTTKLVYADYLDEQGESEPAKLYRDLGAVQRGEDVEPYVTDVETLRTVASGFASMGRVRMDEFTAFESALIPWFRVSWLAVGLATGPCDRGQWRGDA